MILEKMKSIINESHRIVRSVSASFGEYNATWEIGTETDPKEAEESGSKEPISRIAFIQMCGENQFEVVLHDKEGNWFLCTKNDVSGASSVSIEYFKSEREYENCLLEVFPAGHQLDNLGLSVIEGEGSSKTVRVLDKSEEYNSPKNHGLYAVVRTANDGRDYPLESFQCAPTTKENAVEIACVLNNDSAHKHHYEDFYKVVQLPYRLGRGMEDAV
ncbi:MAG: hypothetical protein ACRCTP_04315 [Aeromonas popoffii]|uniref:hypothetical protein n=1 Tax=Aeromonas popoffii TaxID=70856 RepID=UPI003F2E944A